MTWHNGDVASRGLQLGSTSTELDVYVRYIGKFIKYISASYTQAVGKIFFPMSVLCAAASHYAEKAFLQSQRQ